MYGWPSRLCINTADENNVKVKTVSINLEVWDSSKNRQIDTIPKEQESAKRVRAKILGGIKKKILDAMPEIGVNKYACQ